MLQSNGTLLATDALVLQVCSGGEMGLLGAAVDPAFALNGYVYLYYTRNTGNCNSATGRVNRVSRFSMGGNTIDPASELVLLDNIPATGGNHNGGDLEVGQDGYLYVAIGDAGTNPRGGGGTSAQDFSLLTGKIVRITTDGGIPPDNPFVGAPNAAPCAMAGVGAPSIYRCLEIFAYGLRNPYRIAFDTNTGQTRFFINDVGQSTWEEVDEGIKGANYGWASREGFCVAGSTTNCPPPPTGVTDPLTAYGRGAGCTYITAAAFVPNGVWPAEYDGSYLFADGGCNRIFRRTAAGVVDYNNPFHQGSGVIVDMAFVVHGADPSLYYVTNGGSQLRRISYDAPAPSTSAGLTYAALSTAKRVYDTRENVGVLPGTVRGGTTRYVDLGIDDPTVRAAMVNLTMVDTVGPGFLWATEGRTEYPSTSNINATSGEIVANASIVPVDATGNIVIYSSVTTHVIVDVFGVFTTTNPAVSGGRFRSLVPVRLVDTREPRTASNTFDRSAIVAGIDDILVPIAGRASVPADATAVAFILTGLSNTIPTAGFVSTRPAGSPFVTTSNLNTNGNGDIRPNMVIMPLGVDGAITVRIKDVPDIVIDVAGYFVNGTGPDGLYHVIAPSRQVDTRIPLGFPTLGLGQLRTLDPGGAVPNDAAAVSQNLTMTDTLRPRVHHRLPLRRTASCRWRATTTPPGPARPALHSRSPKSPPAAPARSPFSPPAAPTSSPTSPATSIDHER